MIGRNNDHNHSDIRRTAATRFGAEVRRLRSAAKLSLKELGERAGGISSQYCHDIEHGRRIPRDIKKMAEALGTTEQHLKEVAGICTSCGGSGFGPDASKVE